MANRYHSAGESEWAAITTMVEPAPYMRWLGGCEEVSPELQSCIG